MPKRLIIGSHAAVGVICDVLPDGAVRFATMAKNRLPGRLHMAETQKDGERVIATLGRGMLEEAAADPRKFSWKLLLQYPIYWVLEPDNKTPGKRHLKIFYLTSVEGELRYTNKWDGSDMLRPFKWMEATELLDHMRRRSTVRAHYSATKAAINRLAGAHPEVAQMYPLAKGYTEGIMNNDLPDSIAVARYLADK